MAQFARPSTDVQTTSYTKVGGSGTFASCIAESVASADDATSYVKDNAPSSGTGPELIVGLSAVTDPLSSSGHILRVRAQRDGISNNTATWRLFQGSTQIASFTQLLTTGYATYTFTLTGAQADAITDYTALRFRSFGTPSGGFPTGLYVTAAELEVPDAPVTASPPAGGGVARATTQTTRTTGTTAGVAATAGGPAAAAPATTAPATASGRTAATATPVTAGATTARATSASVATTVAAGGVQAGGPAPTDQVTTQDNATPGGASAAANQPGVATNTTTGPVLAGAPAVTLSATATPGPVVASAQHWSSSTPAVPGSATATATSPVAWTLAAPGGAQAGALEPSENRPTSDQAPAGGALAGATGPAARVPAVTGAVAANATVPATAAIVTIGAAAAGSITPGALATATSLIGGVTAGGGSPIALTFIPAPRVTPPTALDFEAHTATLTLIPQTERLVFASQQQCLALTDPGCTVELGD